MNLKLLCAVSWNKDNKCADTDEWLKAIVEDGGYFYRNNRTHQNIDSRSRKWVGLPLENFIGKLVDERNELKGLLKDVNALERSHAKALQNILKLFINTTYGVLGSPYFVVSNTVLANNRTAKAPMGAWMINKALHTRQSITDGGGGLTTIPYLKSEANNPGLGILSDISKWYNSKRGHYQTSLSNIDWKKQYLKSMICQVKRQKYNS
uniref:Uncharacterized mitochondrial protein ymf29 n=1 Tax=Marchantia polymorpha TaxID=3197 RepID=YMF29_MARPO|nr:hypothetical protein MapooMp41 [Marchantia paleacea]P38471.1 RecName: Full=Uncharacterized mitochondrial protein ymf29; AltName: Full=ORF207 [Marchantia polymorpha]AAC09435.1 ORF207 [Marchantia paleacea]